MNALKKILSFIAACVIAGSLAAQAQAHDAKVVKISGLVEIQLPGQTAARTLTADMPVPEGSIIKTGPRAQLLLEAYSGSVATVGSDSVVVIEKLAVVERGGSLVSQEALLDLKKGSIVSTIDPAKKAINKYGVRTPKGVAAARGTVYGVSVTVTGTSVATLSGFVTLNLGAGVSVNIPVGSAALNDSSTVTNLAAAIAASGQQGVTVAQLLQETVQAVAANVAASSSAVGNADTAVAVMASVVSAAASAQPEQAAAFTQVAVAAVSSSTSSTAGSTAAVTAITEAAVRAAPAATAQIAQSAAQAVVETRVTEAVLAAQASGADTAAAAANASQSASETVAAIAQTAVNTSAAVGGTADVQSITDAVATGSASGATDAGTATNTPPPAAPAAPTVTPAAPEAPSAPVVPPVTTTPEMPPDPTVVSPAG